jgi:hypothetical protein
MGLFKSLAKKLFGGGKKRRSQPAQSSVSPEAAAAAEAANIANANAAAEAEAARRRTSTNGLVSLYRKGVTLNTAEGVDPLVKRVTLGA